ncbi:hypothetical protein GQ53DRAFT_885511 [Thozetella sp. PMI_491]|nr:hypothetical protein GQ53DRAFT_885511 [Thozetella sp. PMI_491]
MLRFPFQAVSFLSLFAGLAVSDAPLIHDYDGYNAGNYGSAPNQTYKSSPLVSPLFQVTTWDKSATDASKYIFLGLREPGQEASPLIFSSADLSLVWADPKYLMVADVGVQTFRNAPVLVVGQGAPVQFHTKGSCMILDSSYTLLYNVSVPELTPGLDSDLHECRISDDDTMLITTYTTKPWDLSSVGGSVDDTIVDAGFAEIDIVTGAVLFSWTATDHFALNESYLDYTPGGWDWFHVNSVQKTAEGDYVISCHSIKAILLISGSNGLPIWFLGGRHNEFTDLSGGNATNFGFQHDAVFQNAGRTRLTMFDNHEYTSAEAGCTGNCSRGLELAIDYKAKTVKAARELWHPASLASIALGGTQLLPNGGYMVCWGANPGITEHKADGSVIWNFQFAPWSSDLDIAGIGFNYRTVKGNWVGRPSWTPSIAVAGNGTAASAAFVSWNGATEVKNWAVYVGSSVAGLRFYTKIPRQGFESSVTIGAVAYAQIDALDKSGKVLGTTALVNVKTGAVVQNGRVS